MVRTGQPPKRAIPSRTDEPFKKVFCDFIAPDDSKHRMETQSKRQQLVFDGIHPDTQQPYTWADGEPWTVPRAALPAIDETAAREFLDAATELLVARGWRVEIPAAAAGDEDDTSTLLLQVATELWGEPTGRLKGRLRIPVRPQHG